MVQAMRDPKVQSPYGSWFARRSGSVCLLGWSFIGWWLTTAASGSQILGQTEHAAPASATNSIVPTSILAKQSPPLVPQRGRSSFSGLLFNDRVEAYWSDDGNWLAYVVNAPDGRPCHFKVDLTTGEKTELFDIDKLLAQLNAERDDKLELADLQQIRGVELVEKGAAVEFQLRRHRYRIDSEGQLERLTDDSQSYQESFTLSSRSGPNGPDTELRIRNATESEIELFWLASNGSKTSYGTVAPGDSTSQHTYAGHVWSIVDDQQQELVRLRGTEYPIELTVDEPLVEAFKSFREESREDRRRGRPRPSRQNSSSERFEIRDHNLWIQLEGEFQQLSEDGSAEDRYRGPILESPDGRYVSAIQEVVADEREITIVESSPDEQLQPRVRRIGYAKPGDDIDRPRIRLFDIEQEKQIDVSTELFDNPWRLSSLQWLPSPQRLVFLYNQRGHQCMRVVAIDPETGQAKTLIDEQSDTFIDYQGKQYLRFVKEGEQLLWMSERDGYNHLYRFDAESGELVNRVTRGRWVVRDVVRIDEQTEQIWFSAGGLNPTEDPYYQHLCRVDFDGSDFQVLTSGDGDHAWDFSPDRRWLIDRYSRVDMATVTVLRDAETGSPVCTLAQGDFSQLVQNGWSVPERFVAKGRDDEIDIFGIIVRPSNFDPREKYPVIEKIYAGPHSAHVPKSFNRLRQLHELANEGFILVQIDGMGTSHRSKAFHDVCWKNLADAGFPDRIAWMRAAAEQHPEMDLERVGIFGGSAGGQNAMRAVLDYHDFYRVAVADCGCHDNRMDKMWWNELWMGWPVDEAYADSSNVEHADRLGAELLLIVGELDTNVDPASTMQVADALVKADKDFELLIVPGAGHGAAETRYGSRRRLDFLRRHLLEEAVE